MLKFILIIQILYNDLSFIIMYSRYFLKNCTVTNKPFINTTVHLFMQHLAMKSCCLAAKTPCCMIGKKTP